MANLGTVPDRDYFMDSLENLNSLPPFPEMLADVEGEEFLDDLERLAASLLKEVEQDDNRGVVENVADKVKINKFCHYFVCQTLGNQNMYYNFAQV